MAAIAFKQHHTQHSAIRLDIANHWGMFLLLDKNPRNKERKAVITDEQKHRRKAGCKLAEEFRYNECSTVERVNGWLKDEFNARTVRVKGHSKVMAHLMFNIITLTANQLVQKR